MAKNKRRSRSRSRRGPATGQTTAPSKDDGGDKDPRVSKENGRLVGLSVIGVVLSIVIALPPLTPILTTAPIVLPLLRRLRAGKHAAVTGAFLRWGLTVFLTVLLSAAFVRDRMLSSFPFAANALRGAEDALTGSGGPPAGFVYMLSGFVAFVALAAASRGIAACVLASIALGAAAAATSVLYAHGNNVLLITLIACPPWQWALFAGAVLAFAPAADWGGRKMSRIGGEEAELRWFARRMMVPAGLFVLALLLRIVLAGPYIGLARHWTHF